MKALALIWSAGWRAQALHLGIFVLLPLVAALLKAILGIVLLPFLLIGEGSLSKSLTGDTSHMVQPACWVVLIPCSFGDQALFQFPIAASAPTPLYGETSSSAEPEPFMPLPSAFTIRHAWFVAWLAWFIGFLVLRERAKRKA